MSWVFAVNVGMSQIVQVVSILDVIIRLGETVFQSSDVRGAVCSGDLELESRASGVSFADDWGLVLDERPRVLLEVYDGCEGNDHSLRWSPDVARRSVDCFLDDAGSQSILVTGYECVASAVLTYVNSHCG